MVHFATMLGEEEGPIDTEPEESNNSLLKYELRWGFFSGTVRFARLPTTANALADMVAQLDEGERRQVSAKRTAHRSISQSRAIILEIILRAARPKQRS